MFPKRTEGDTLKEVDACTPSVAPFMQDATRYPMLPAEPMGSGERGENGKTPSEWITNCMLNRDLLMPCWTFPSTSIRAAAEDDESNGQRIELTPPPTQEAMLCGEQGEEKVKGCTCPTRTSRRSSGGSGRKLELPRLDGELVSTEDAPKKNIKIQMMHPTLPMEEEPRAKGEPKEGPPPFEALKHFVRLTEISKPATPTSGLPYTRTIASSVGEGSSSSTPMTLAEVPPRSPPPASHVPQSVEEEAKRNSPPLSEFAASVEKEEVRTPSPRPPSSRPAGPKRSGALLSSLQLYPTFSMEGLERRSTSSCYTFHHREGSHQHMGRETWENREEGKREQSRTPEAQKKGNAGGEEGEDELLCFTGFPTPVRISPLPVHPAGMGAVRVKEQGSALSFTDFARGLWLPMDTSSESVAKKKEVTHQKEKSGKEKDREEVECSTTDCSTSAEQEQQTAEPIASHPLTCPSMGTHTRMVMQQREEGEMVPFLCVPAPMQETPAPYPSVQKKPAEVQRNLTTRTRKGSLTRTDTHRKGTRRSLSSCGSALTVSSSSAVWDEAEALSSIACSEEGNATPLMDRFPFPMVPCEEWEPIPDDALPLYRLAHEREGKHEKRYVSTAAVGVSKREREEKEGVRWQPPEGPAMTAHTLLPDHSAKEEWEKEPQEQQKSRSADAQDPPKQNAWEGEKKATEVSQDTPDVVCLLPAWQVVQDLQQHQHGGTSKKKKVVGEGLLTYYLPSDRGQASAWRERHTDSTVKEWNSCKSMTQPPTESRAREKSPLSYPSSTSSTAAFGGGGPWWCTPSSSALPLSPRNSPRLPPGPPEGRKVCGVGDAYGLPRAGRCVAPRTPHISGVQWQEEEDGHPRDAASPRPPQTPSPSFPSSSVFSQTEASYRLPCRTMPSSYVGGRPMASSALSAEGMPPGPMGKQGKRGRQCSRQGSAIRMHSMRSAEEGGSSLHSPSTMSIPSSVEHTRLPEENSAREEAFRVPPSPPSPPVSAPPQHAFCIKGERRMSKEGRETTAKSSHFYSRISSAPQARSLAGTRRPEGEEETVRLSFFADSTWKGRDRRREPTPQGVGHEENMERKRVEDSCAPFALASGSPSETCASRSITRALEVEMATHLAHRLASHERPPSSRTGGQGSREREEKEHATREENESSACALVSSPTPGVRADHAEVKSRGEELDPVYSTRSFHERMGGQTKEHLFYVPPTTPAPPLPLSSSPVLLPQEFQKGPGRLQEDKAEAPDVHISLLGRGQICIRVAPKKGDPSTSSTLVMSIPSGQGCPPTPASSSSSPEAEGEPQKCTHGTEKRTTLPSRSSSLLERTDESTREEQYRLRPVAPREALPSHAWGPPPPSVLWHPHSDWPCQPTSGDVGGDVVKHDSTCCRRKSAEHSAHRVEQDHRPSPPPRSPRTNEESSSNRRKSGSRRGTPWMEPIAMGGEKDSSSLPCSSLFGVSSSLSTHSYGVTNTTATTADNASWGTLNTTRSSHSSSLLLCMASPPFPIVTTSSCSASSSSASPMTAHTVPPKSTVTMNPEGRCASCSPPPLSTATTVPFSSFSVSKDLHASGAPLSRAQAHEEWAKEGKESTGNEVVVDSPAEREARMGKRRQELQSKTLEQLRLLLLDGTEREEEVQRRETDERRRNGTRGGHSPRSMKKERLWEHQRPRSPPPPLSDFVCSPFHQETRRAACRNSLFTLLLPPPAILHVGEKWDPNREIRAPSPWLASTPSSVCTGKGERSAHNVAGELFGFISKIKDKWGDEKGNATAAAASVYPPKKGMPRRWKWKDEQRHGAAPISLSSVASHMQTPCVPRPSGGYRRETRSTPSPSPLPPSPLRTWLLTSSSSSTPSIIPPPSTTSEEAVKTCQNTVEDPDTHRGLACQKCEEEDYGSLPLRTQEYCRMPSSPPCALSCSFSCKCNAEEKHNRKGSVNALQAFMI